MNTTDPPMDNTPAADPAPAPAAAPAVAPEPQVQDLRRRMQQLLSIPDRDRSDAEWDELVEIEIRLAPGNRADSNSIPGQPRQHNNGGGKPFGQNNKPRHGPKPKHFGGGQNKHRNKPPKPPAQ